MASIIFKNPTQRAAFMYFFLVSSSEMDRGRGVPRKVYIYCAFLKCNPLVPHFDYIICHATWVLNVFFTTIILLFRLKDRKRL